MGCLMKVMISVIFFLSGVSALIFETLWFRKIGLVLGNSVWASSIVIAGFMAGLALGNTLTIRYGQRLKRPILVFAGLELVIGATGFIAVVLTPLLPELMVPLFRAIFDLPWGLNLIRLLLAFMILLLPTTAMGMTLPILVKALCYREPSFGRVLGSLYGWNTLGAVAGAVLGETIFIGLLGLLGTAILAFALNAFNALIVFAIAQKFSPTKTRRSIADVSNPQKLRPVAIPKRLLMAAFLSGGILLAFEVVGLRFLQLFVVGTSLTFALILAVILAGIGLGGLVSSWWFRRKPNAYDFVVQVALTGALALVIAYFSLPTFLNHFPLQYTANPKMIITLSLAFFFPISFVSGILFTLIGSTIKEELGDETLSAGYLTLANTLGALSGAIVAGFVLLPLLGMEMSFFLLAAMYGVVALLLVPSTAKPKRFKGNFSNFSTFSLSALYLLSLFLFPVGLMKDFYLRYPVRRYTQRDTKIIRIHEGLTETIIVLEEHFLGKPLFYRLVTNGYSMAGTSWRDRRYMKLFVYLPVALKPEPRDALLIGYGTGSTAEALSNLKSLKEIHIVDVSKDIFDTSKFINPFRESPPLDDSRVKIQIEDGRFFLQTSARHFDIITGEPPPPKGTGVVNLYTQEYFQLIYDRLREGGICSYWLPVNQLQVSDTKAIIKAFCNVFEDCTMWNGSGFDWILLGTRNDTTSSNEALFASQWNRASSLSELRTLGIELPEQLGALFLAGSDDLLKMTEDTKPVTDNHPLRLSPELLPKDASGKEYFSIMDVAEAKTRFKKSDFIKQHWPQAFIAKTLEYFDYQEIINARYANTDDFSNLHKVLTNSQLHTLAIWLLKSDADELRNVKDAVKRGYSNETTNYILGVEAMADRNFDQAEHYFRLVREKNPSIDYLRIYALCMGGKTEEATELAASLNLAQKDRSAASTLKWLRRTFDLKLNP
ncbi:MAG: spermidine synthase [Caldithrix sp.]|nr:MAG: spermidine synthase [Caldithrix sp.]